MSFQRIAILGVGLLGGSIGLAIKAKLKGVRVIGYGRDPASLAVAQSRGSIDETTVDLFAAAREADLVILCTPVGLFEMLLRTIGPVLKAGAIVTDVGSTKATVVGLGEAILPATATFVGSHPMAGSEKRGPANASADLLDDALVLVTPSDKTPPAATAAIEDFWLSLGARLKRLDAGEHDRLLAAASHLPHVVSSLLMAVQNEQSVAVAGRGLQDMTRLSAGDATVWRDIVMDNTVGVIQMLDRFIEQADWLKMVISNGDADEVETFLRDQAKRRLTAFPPTD